MKKLQLALLFWVDLQGVFAPEFFTQKENI